MGKDDTAVATDVTQIPPVLLVFLYFILLD